MAGESGEMTVEEKAKKMEENREYSYRRINSDYLLRLALPGLFKVSGVNYGDLNNLFESDSLRTLSRAPDQESWNELFSNLYSSEDGVVGNSELRNKASKAYLEHLGRLKVEDIAKLVGIKGDLNDDYEGKYVSALDKKAASEVIGGYLDYLVNSQAQRILGEVAKSSAKGLEKLLIKQKED